MAKENRPDETVNEVRWGIIGGGDVAEHKSGPALYGVPHSHLIAVMSRREHKAAYLSSASGEVVPLPS